MRQTSTRLARPEDIPVLAVFERELARVAFPDDPIEDLAYHEGKLRRAMLREPDGMVVIVDTETDQLLAWLWAGTKTTLATGERYGVLRSIYVRDPVRGQGLGRLLGEYAVRYFAGSDIHRVVAKVHSGGEAAQRLLEHIGFESVHITYELRC